MLSDRYTLVTMINQELDGLEDALREAAEDGLRFKAVPTRNRGVELTIIFPEPIVKVNVSVKKRRKLNFQVIYQSREDLMRDRIRKRSTCPSHHLSSPVNIRMLNGSCEPVISRMPWSSTTS